MSGHGGRREGAGRKGRPDPALLAGEQRTGKPGPLSAAQRDCYANILAALNAAPLKDGKKQDKLLEDEPVEIKRWRILVDAVLDPKADIAAKRLSLDALKYLYDKRDGKAIQPVDVDATLDSSVTVHLGSLMPKEFREPGAVRSVRR